PAPAPALLAGHLNLGGAAPLPLRAARLPGSSAWPPRHEPADAARPHVSTTCLPVAAASAAGVLPAGVFARAADGARREPGPSAVCDPTDTGESGDAGARAGRPAARSGLAGTRASRKGQAPAIQPVGSRKPGEDRAAT